MQELTKEQKIVITAYTGTLCCEFSDFHGDLEKRIGHPVWTHQLGDKQFVNEKVKPLYKDDFMAMIGEKPQ